MRATAISVSQGSAVTSVWPCVRLFQVFGRVFGCFLVFGRVFGCYNFLAVCLAVTSVGRAFGRFKCWSVSVLLFSSCFYLYAFLPVSGFAHSFYLSRLLFSSWDLPFCLGMSYLTLMYFLGRFKVLPIFYYCSALFMHSLFLYILCVLFLLCFDRDFCFLLFRWYSRSLFLPRRAFVLFCSSRGFSFLFYAMQFCFTSP